MFGQGQGVRVTLGGTPPQPHRGTLTPLIPLSLRAIKGEGEIRIEAHVRALHARGPLIQYWGEGDGFPIGVGIDVRGEIRTEARTGAVHPCGPLVQYWVEGRAGFRLGGRNDGWRGWVSADKVELRRGAVDSSRGLGMGVGSGEGLGHERQDGRYPPRSVGEVLDLVRLQIPTQNLALPI